MEMISSVPMPWWQVPVTVRCKWPIWRGISRYGHYAGWSRVDISSYAVARNHELSEGSPITSPAALAHGVGPVCWTRSITSSHCRVPALQRHPDDRAQAVESPRGRQSRSVAGVGRTCYSP